MRIGSAVTLVIFTLLAILLLGIALDYGWKRKRDSRPSQAQVSG